MEVVQASLEIAKAYAAKFGLRWANDLTDWEDDIGPALGGAYADGPLYHEPPVIYVMAPEGPRALRVAHDEREHHC